MVGHVVLEDEMNSRMFGERTGQRSMCMGPRTAALGGLAIVWALYVIGFGGCASETAHKGNSVVVGEGDSASACCDGTAEQTDGVVAADGKSSDADAHGVPADEVADRNTEDRVAAVDAREFGESTDDTDLTDIADGTDSADTGGFDEPNCPTAIASVKEGGQVIPQTVLHLFGDKSTAKVGEVVAWKWTVKQPMGSKSSFLPHSEFATPTFEANVAGEYLFSLTVTDSMNVTSCKSDKIKVVVIPDESIHVELLWDTPDDPDQGDEGPEAGADMDLHFVHPLATGPDLDEDGLPDGWFDYPFDCFWFNPNPQWASFDPSIDDDPSLDRDDTDGAGPENLNLNIAEDNTTYRIGVHYWHDHNFGPSHATVRIYIYGSIEYTVTDLKMVQHDMWEVATLEWPSGTIKPIVDKNGNPKVIPNYENPFFFQP